MNMYDAAHTFKLVIPALSIDIEIAEPIDYSSARIKLTRDRQYYGFSYEFFDETVKLRFELDNGISHLRTAYAAAGGDAIAKFQHYYFNVTAGANELLFEGNLNFNTYVDDGTTVSCEIEKVSFENLLRSRFDTKVSLTEAASLDGQPSNLIQSVPIALHSKMILRRFLSQPKKVDGGSLVYDNYTAFEADPSNPQWDNNTLINTYFTHDFAGNVIYNEGASDMNGQPFSANGQPDEQAAREQLIIKEDGQADITVSVSLKFWSKDFFDIAAFEAQSVITTYLVIYDKNGNLKVTHTIGGDVLGTWGDGFAKTHTKSAVIGAVSLEKGDKIYIYSRLIYQLTAGVTYDYSLTGITFRIYAYDNSLLVENKTTAPPTTAITYRLRDSIRKAISMTTNVNSALVSDFLNKEGFAFAITNGMIIRSETVANEPVKVSLKELIESSHALWNLGVLINDNKVTIEPFTWFFQNRLILALTEVSDFTEETATELLFNELEIGYTKTTQENIQSLYEFNNRHSKLLPIRTYKKNISKLCQFIGSGYALEFQRRVQFDENNDKGGPNDSDIFIISLSRVTPLAAEKNEFMTAANIISPETSYNLRISPQRMAIKWKPFIDSIAAFKPETDATITTDTLLGRKGKLSLTWLTGASYPVEITPATAVIENDPLYVDDDLKVFYPVQHKFKTRLSFSNLLILKAALTASYGVSKDNGYITYPDNDGVIQSGFVMDLIYNPVSEECEFTCLKKY
jgi:hypothetical protein